MLVHYHRHLVITVILCKKWGSHNDGIIRLYTQYMFFRLSVGVIIVVRRNLIFLVD